MSKKPFLYQYGKNWYYVFLNPKTNKRSRLSCNTSNQNEALKYLTTDEFKQRFEELTKQDKFVIKHKENTTTNTTELECSYTIYDLIPKLQDYARINHKRHNDKSYYKLFEILIEVIGENKKLDDITFFDIEKFKAKRTLNGKATCNLDLRVMKASFNLAKTWGFMKHNPCIGVKQHKLTRRKHQVFSNEQINLLLNNCPDIWFRDMIIFALYTGMRREEILTLRKQDIDLQNDVITIKNYAGFTTKNYSDREIPIFEDLKPVLLNIIQRSTGEFLFTDRSNSKFCGSYISHKFKKLLRQCNLSEDLHFHNLRHTFVTNCIIKGMPLPMVQKIAGHRDISTTMGYISISTKHIQNQITGKSLYSFD